MGLCGVAHAGDGTPVSSITTTRVPATAAPPYSDGTHTILYGVGDNVRIGSATVSGVVYQRSSVSKPVITIKRIDNAVVTGERKTFFYAGSRSGPSSGRTIRIEGDEAASMEIAMNNDYITTGGLDVFLNRDRGSSEKANNIERVDFVVSNGIALPSNAALVDQIGTIANEKHGNNSYKIALITALDGSGPPSAYGPLKLIQGNSDYGNLGRPRNASGTQLTFERTRNEAGPTPPSGNGPMKYANRDSNFMGLSFISFADLGALPNETVYGYSLFPLDQQDSNDLVGLSDAPTNTSGSANGGDIFGGTFAVFSSLAAEAETSEGGPPDLEAAKRVRMYDPMAEGLHAIPGNEVIYTLAITNRGSGSPDDGTIFMVDEPPGEHTFFFGDMNDSGPGSEPIVFTDLGSGLSLDPVDGVGYAVAGPVPSEIDDCAYEPVSTYDSLVRYVCVAPSGVMAGSSGGLSFEVEFRTRID
ncbi:MAG: hypothetical protein AAF253_01485 [Pseudomonadota bacterium]